MFLVKRQVNENKDSAPEIISPNCVLAKRLLKPIFLIEVHDDKLQKNASVNFGSKSIIIVILSYAFKRSEFSIRDAKIPGSFQSFTPGIFWKFQSRDFFIPGYLRAHDPGIKSPGILSM